MKDDKEEKYAGKRTKDEGEGTREQSRGKMVKGK